MFDFTSSATLRGVPNRVLDVIDLSGNPHMPMVIVGNKSDIPEGTRRVKQTRLVNAMKDIAMAPYERFEMSVKNYANSTAAEKWQNRDLLAPLQALLRQITGNEDLVLDPC